MAEESVAALFASTIVPGCLLALFYFAINFIFCRRWMKPVAATRQVDSGTTFTTWLGRFARDTYAAIPALLFPVILIGGIFGGVFTPTEAAAVSCVYAILIGVLVYKGLGKANFKSVFVEAGGTIGMVVILVGFGMFFSRVLLRVGVAEAMVNMILTITKNPVLILLLINVLLLILGMFMESICILLITVPLLLPLFAEIGMNPIHAGAMVCINIGIGQITPPFAVGLFVGARLSGVYVHEIAKPALLFIVLGAVPVLFLTTFIPDLALWLPIQVCGPGVVGISP
jgi:C4-dicarboxylate transporter DctM subunit